MPTLNMQSNIGDIADEIGNQYYRKGFPTKRLTDGTLDLTSVAPPQHAVARRVHSYQNACRYAAAVPNIAALYKKHKDSFPANLQGEIDSLTDEDIKILQVVALMRASGRSSADPRNPDNPSLQAGDPKKGELHTDPDYSNGIHYAPQGVRECYKKLIELGVEDAKAQKFSKVILDSEQSDTKKFSLYDCILKDINVIETMRDRNMPHGKGKEVPITWCPFFEQSSGTNGAAAKKEFTDVIKAHVDVIKAQQGFVVAKMVDTKGGSTILGGLDKKVPYLEQVQIDTENKTYNVIVSQMPKVTFTAPAAVPVPPIVTPLSPPPAPAKVTDKPSSPVDPLLPPASSPLAPLSAAWPAPLPTVTPQQPGLIQKCDWTKISGIDAKVNFTAATAQETNTDPTYLGHISTQGSTDKAVIVKTDSLECLTDDPKAIVAGLKLLVDTAKSTADKDTPPEPLVIEANNAFSEERLSKILKELAEQKIPVKFQPCEGCSENIKSLIETHNASLPTTTKEPTVAAKPSTSHEKP